MKYDKQETVIAIVLGIVALAFVGGVVWVTQDIYNVQRDVSANGQELVRKQAEQKRLQALSDLAEDLSENRASVAAQFVTKNDEVIFLEAVETSARKSGASLEITRVTFEDIERESKDSRGNITAEKIGEELVLVLDATGSWREVFQFVSLVETLALALDVRHTQLRLLDPSESDKWGTTMIVGLRVRI
ncbi:hypothetical protein COB55_05470 [Candidatus Wolfebacteria bacterium]|nr:MAG: hypothetical protein COB55_05470 [Candidatus Wolfebacteria bacterium]